MMISTMTINDYEELRQLWIDTPGMGVAEIDDSVEGIVKYLNRNPNTCFVAREGEKLIGGILSGHDGRRGYIYHTAISNEYRGQGIGSTLLEHVLEALKDEGITKVALLVFEDNEIGNTFWERKGFQARRDVVYRNKELIEVR